MRGVKVLGTPPCVDLPGIRDYLHPLPELGGVDYRASLMYQVAGLKRALFYWHVGCCIGFTIQLA